MIIRYLFPYEIFVKERTLHRQLTDDEINQLLAENGLVENIDKMLLLSTDELTTSKDISEKTSTTSLSYHLGNDNCKKQIKRIFSLDRSALHVIDKQFLNIQITEDKNVLYKFLCERKKEVLDALANEGLPTFSLMRVNEYLQ